MLASDEKSKICEQLDKALQSIQQDAMQSMKKGIASSDIINRVTTLTVNKIAPQSKMLLSSAYNMMMVRTLSDPFFSDSQNKAAFYEADILKEITSKFDFAVPTEINYQRDYSTLKTLAASGAVVVAGGLIGVTLTSWIPVGIAVVLAGIMGFVIKSKCGISNNNLNQLITEYLQNIRHSFMLWIDAIESFYDNKVAELKKNRS